MAVIKSDISRTLQEYLLEPGHVKKNIPAESIDLSSELVAPNKRRIRLNVPITTAAMQSVTGPKMAIGMAKLGGVGVIYCSQPVDEEASMIREVKRSKAGFVVPETLSPENSISHAIERMDRTGYSKFPITEDGRPNGRLVGLLTDNDFDPKQHSDLRIADRMKDVTELKLAYVDEIDGDIKKADQRIRAGHHSILPVIDRGGNLSYVVFRKDMDAHERNPLELTDKEKRYVVGAAINTRDYKERVPSMVDAGADFLVLDTSQGDSDFAGEALDFVNGEFPDVPIIGGNIVTAEGFRYLVEHGVDAIKVGMGSGSICITQEQVRIGLGQGTAVWEVATLRNEYEKEKGVHIPICSDGGVITAGDVQIALALGADYVMVGSYVAGTDESNGPERDVQREVDGKIITVKVKEYWGEGSRRARGWAAARYGHEDFEEGFERTEPYSGKLADRLNVALAQVRDGIRRSGSYSIDQFHENAVLRVLSTASMTLSRSKPIGG